MERATLAVAPCAAPPAARWPGRQRVYCGGHVVIGPPEKKLRWTCGLVYIPTLLFFTFESAHHAEHGSLGTLMVAVGAVVVASAALLLVLLSDPGILPRRGWPESYLSDEQGGGGRAPRIERPDVESGVLSDGDQPRREAAPLSSSALQDALVDEEEHDGAAGSAAAARAPRLEGHGAVLKYCPTCGIYRPPRAVHCSVTDCCIDRFDHYCPWLGNAVGRRNYRAFLAFITSVFVLCCAIFSLSVKQLTDLADGGLTSLEAVTEAPVALLLSIYTFVTVWFLAVLCLYHYYLVSKNMTTNEHVKGNFRSVFGNPYSRGCVLNWWEMFRDPLPPSLVAVGGVAGKEFREFPPSRASIELFSPAGSSSAGDHVPGPEQPSGPSSLPKPLDDEFPPETSVVIAPSTVYESEHITQGGDSSAGDPVRNGGKLCEDAGSVRSDAPAVAPAQSSMLSAEASSTDPTRSSEFPASALVSTSPQSSTSSEVQFTTAV